MNLNTIVEVKRPKSFEEIGWRDGHAFLGGGTWLFSEPQVATDTLVDLPGLGWPALTVTPAGLEIAATCKIVELHDFKGPPEWRAVPLFDQCIDAFLMSFKIWNAATVGGNVCMSLPAAALSKRFAMRQVSLTHHGRSAALIVATVGDKGEDFLLTISAATPRPVHLRFKKTPSASELRQAIEERLPPDAWFQDVHGSAPYKRHITFYLAEQIRAELS